MKFLEIASLKKTKQNKTLKYTLQSFIASTTSPRQAVICFQLVCISSAFFRTSGQGRIIQKAVLCVWIPGLSRISLRFIHNNPLVNILSLFPAVQYSSAWLHYDCSPVLLVMHSWVISSFWMKIAWFLRRHIGAPSGDYCYNELSHHSPVFQSLQSPRLFGLGHNVPLILALRTLCLCSSSVPQLWLTVSVSAWLLIQFWSEFWFSSNCGSSENPISLNWPIITSQWRHHELMTRG